MGRTADWGRRPHLIQYLLQIVGEGVEEYCSKIDNQQNQIHQGYEVAPVLRLEFIYSKTARFIIADSEDPTPDYRSGERAKH